MTSHRCKRCGRFYAPPQGWCLCPRCQDEADEEHMAQLGCVPWVAPDGVLHIIERGGESR